MSEEPSVADEPSKDEVVQKKIEKDILDAVVTDNPNVAWDDIVGYEKVVEMLKESVALPVKFPQLFTGARFAPSVIWLYGHPGAGKTFISKATITSVFGDVTTFDVSSFTTRLARTGRFVRTLFRLARERKPCIILLDEIDRFFKLDQDCDQETENTTVAFLHEMHKYQENRGIFVIGHSCQPWLLGAGIRRRADRAGHLTLPDTPTRAHLFQHQLNSQNIPHGLKEADFLELGSKTEGYTPANIICVVRDAQMESIRELQKATHFKTVSGPSAKDPSIIMDGLLAPCSPDDPDAQETSWVEHEDRLCCRHVNLADVLKCIQKARSTVIDEEAKQMEEFRANYDVS